MSNTQEPFGYFKAEPFGWTDCAETDEGAQPLWDNNAMCAIEKQRDDAEKQRDELLALIKKIKEWDISDFALAIPVGLREEIQRGRRVL